MARQANADVSYPFLCHLLISHRSFPRRLPSSLPPSLPSFLAFLSHSSIIYLSPFCSHPWGRPSFFFLTSSPPPSSIPHQTTRFFSRFFFLRPQQPPLYNANRKKKLPIKLFDDYGLRKRKPWVRWYVMIIAFFSFFRVLCTRRTRTCCLLSFSLVFFSKPAYKQHFKYGRVKLIK